MTEKQPDVVMYVGRNVYYDGSRIGRSGGIGGSSRPGKITSRYYQVEENNYWVEVTLDNGMKIAMLEERMAKACNIEEEFKIAKVMEELGYKMYLGHFFEPDVDTVMHFVKDFPETGSYVFTVHGGQPDEETVESIVGGD